MAACAAAAFVSGMRGEVEAQDPPRASPSPNWPSLAALERAMQTLPEEATLVAFEPTGANHVLLARRVRAAPTALPPLLGDPAAYKAAVPSFERAEIVATTARPDGSVDRLMAWELEVPLWNLEGQLWLKPFGQSIQIRFSEGAFSPGQFLWRWRALRPARAGDAQKTLLVLSGTANTREANYGTRKIAARSPLAEPAMTVAAAYATIEGLVDGAARAKVLPRWPSANMNAPALAALTPVADKAALALGYPGPTGVVLRRADGRLAQVQIAQWSGLAPEAAVAALAQAKTWRAVPGWKKITANADGAAAARWEIDASFPFLDFDATWQVEIAARTVRGTAIDGAAEGAVWSWHAQPAPAGSPGRSLLVFSLHPRLDRIGFVPRKFIAKEPLLEPGLALALAYVDAVSLARALPPPSP